MIAHFCGSHNLLLVYSVLSETVVPIDLNYAPLRAHVRRPYYLIRGTPPAVRADIADAPSRAATQFQLSPPFPTPDRPLVKECYLCPSTLESQRRPGATLPATLPRPMPAPDDRSGGTQFTIRNERRSAIRVGSLLVNTINLSRHVPMVYYRPRHGTQASDHQEGRPGRAR